MDRLSDEEVKLNEIVQKLKVEAELADDLKAEAICERIRQIEVKIQGIYDILNLV